MIEHGLQGEPLAEGNTRTLCKCGKEFDTDRGLNVHLGKMRKSPVLREKGDKQA